MEWCRVDVDGPDHGEPSTAISAKANGIATTVINATGFIHAVIDAMNAGIPVITYNANGSTASPTNGPAYVGQDL